MIILRQREFARRNYEGLSESEQNELREYRNKLAKQLLEERKEANSERSRRIAALNKNYKTMLDNIKNNPSRYETPLHSVAADTADAENYRKHSMEKTQRWWNEDYDNALSDAKKAAERRERTIREVHKSQASDPHFNANTNTQQSTTKQNSKSQPNPAQPNTTINNNNRQSTQGKIGVGGYAKKVWNGEVGLGKTGNRAAIIGTSALVGGGIALHRYNKKKKEEEEKKKKF